MIWGRLAVCAAVAILAAFEPDDVHATPFPIPCGQTGGCVTVKPDPCANGGCEQDQTAAPSFNLALDQYARQFQSTIQGFRPYVDINIYAGLAPPSSEWELSTRIDSFYAMASTAFNEAMRNASGKLGYAKHRKERRADLVWHLSKVNNAIATLSAKSQALKPEVKRLEAQWTEVEIRAVGLLRAAQTLANDLITQRALISYQQVFGPDPTFMAQHRDHQPERLLIEQWKKRPELNFSHIRPDIDIAAYAAMQPVLPVTPLVTAMNYRNDAPIPSKLNSLTNLDINFHNVARQVEDAQKSTDKINVEIGQLQAAMDKAIRERNTWDVDVKKLIHHQSIANQSLPIALENHRYSAGHLAREMMISMAKDEALDAAKDAVDKLLGVSGIASALPTSAEDMVIKAATEGRRILIPQGGFKTQWDAFLRVQQQTSTLVSRSQGYIDEAARLCAQGTPAEMQDHIAKVFGSLDDEAADYVRTVGFSDLPEDGRNLFTKALDTYLEKRKSSR